MALIDDLKALAPERVADGDTRLQYFIDRAAERINRRVFAQKSDFATVLLSAHMATRFSADMVPTDSGSVTQEKVGDLQVQLAALKMDGDEEFATTTYGAAFAQMRKAVLTTPLVL